MSAIKEEECFGYLADKVRGHVTYKISPFEQRAFAGVIENLGHTVNRIARVGLIVPYFLVSFAIYKYVEDEHLRLQRKNPNDYKDFYDTEGVAYKKRKTIKKKWPKN